ncbi:MAG: CHASE2 domain-containing protein [Erythrobacter sp.]
MNAARLMLEWAILLALAIAGALYAQSTGLTGRIDNQLFDRAAALATPDVDQDIVIVAIDDQSLADQGTWPWSRALHARLVDRLDAAGARLVVLDILFLDATDTEADTALADSVARSGSVFLPHTFTRRLNAVSGVDPLMPLQELTAASAGVGHVVVEPDADGVLRRFDLTLETDTGTYPHVALLVDNALRGETDGDALSSPGDSREALVPFNPEAAFPHESASNVLAGSTVSGFFKDKIVLVGATAQGMGDRYSVAAGTVGLMTGVGMQANLLNALQNDALITTTGLFVQGVVAVVLLFALFMAFWHLPPRYVLICAAGLVIALLLVSIILLGTARIWFAPGATIVTIILAYPLWSWRRLSNVSRYLDREATRLIADDPVPVASEGLDYVTRQIDQLRRLISTVRDSLTFLRQVIEAAPDAIVVLDRSGRTEMLNERAMELFPEWSKQEEATFTELLLFSGARQEKNGSELVTADGRTFLIACADMGGSMTGGSGGDADGVEAGAIIALRDVSELRALDDERQQMLEFLSHDMRTPQVAIVGLTNQANGAGANRDMVKRIRKQAERTLKLADDFVQLARLSTPELQIADTDIGALLEEACDRAYAPSGAKQITIAQTLPEEPCFASVDASLIARMMDNLIGNAIKYSEAGTRICVSLSGGEAGPMVIEVADEGPGLSEARLANPFARFGAHATHAGPSAGLGLALVKRVVDIHRGTIALHSTPGEGTRFTITIPVD